MTEILVPAMSIINIHTCVHISLYLVARSLSVYLHTCVFASLYHLHCLYHLYHIFCIHQL